MNRRHSILIVEDEMVISMELAATLKRLGYDISGQAIAGEEAVIKAGELLPDLILMDIRLQGDMDGIEACNKIKKLNPDANILILTMYPEKQYAAYILKCGARGYLTKKVSKNELHMAVRSVARHEIYISESSKDLVIEKLVNSKDQTSPTEILSNRELQVMRLLSQGKGIKEIATELGLSIKTIDNYRSRILSKLGLKRTIDLILYAKNPGI